MYNVHDFQTQITKSVCVEKFNESQWYKMIED